LILSIATELVGVAAALFIVFYGGRQVIEGRLSFGIFALFMAALLSLIRPFKKLSQVNSIVEQALAAVKRIYEVLDTQPSIREIAHSKALPPIRKSIVFRNVYFDYGDRAILEDVNLEVQLGSTLAIVGPSGVGKTTLVDLIPRLYDTQKGQILIDGQDIREVTLNSLRNQIGIVTQETILFNDTVRANISYGRPNAPDNEIKEAAKEAYADEFILKLAQRYDTIIGDRGMKLSGGEKQRIAIARALLKNPPILILDEATSQLDTESERLVQQALERLIHGRTVFIIAHRLSTVKSASQIVVLDKGRIVEKGTHQQLLEKNGLYKRLYSMQEFAE
jgi:subfamily B ATP-binding cassette protein MsbA